MSNRTKQKRRKLGYALFIKRDTAAKYERVGFLFDCSREAAEYREQHYPTVTKWSIQAVRVSAEKVGPADTKEARA